MALEFHFVLVLLLVYGTSYLFKFLERYDIPIRLVEIIAGIVFSSILGVVDESIAGWEFFTTLAALGLLVIMFEAGLELDPKPVLKRPKTVAFWSSGSGRRSSAGSSAGWRSGSRGRRPSSWPR